MAQLFMTKKTSNSDNVAIDKSTETLKQAETALSRALSRELRQTAEFKQSFAEFSHEIKTPLNAILGYVDMMQMEIHGPLGHPKYIEYANIVQTASQHLLQLCGQLDTDQTDSPEILEEDVDVRQTINNVTVLFEPLAKNRGIELNSEIGGNFPILQTDPIRLNQILINLVSNAIKYTPKGGP